MYSTWIFKGELGAGKTSLIKKLIEELGSKDVVTSPTFSLINEYVFDGQNRLYHLDLYRIKSEMEAFQLGITEYIDADNYCFIEWPEIIESYLQTPYIEISIHYIDQHNREYQLKKHD